MKPFTFAGAAFAAVLGLAACDPKPRSRPEPAPGPQHPPVQPGQPTIDPNVDPSATRPNDPGTTKPGPVIPEPTARRNPEYGIKIEGKSGYVRSPYDSQGRPIDVRGLPPGTEVEDPYTPGRTLLVP